MADEERPWWNSDLIKLAVAILLAVLGATSVQIVFPARSDPFTGTDGQKLELMISDLKGRVAVLTVQLNALEAKMTALLQISEIQKPPEKTRDRIMSLEEELNRQNGYRPPHRGWQ